MDRGTRYVDKNDVPICCGVAFDVDVVSRFSVTSFPVRVVCCSNK